MMEVILLDIRIQKNKIKVCGDMRMPNCFECKIYGTTLNALCPMCDKYGNPIEACFQFEQKIDNKDE